MVTSFMICILLSCALGQQMHGSNCPMKCTCTDLEVTCYDLTSYPTSYPPNTTKIVIESSYLKEIPRSALQELTELLSFEILSSKIGSINSQAFVDLSVENLTIVNSSIQTIESKAFEKCKQIESFLIKDTEIHLIEEYAFSDMMEFGRFKMESSSIGTVQTHAFFNINYFEHIEFTGLRISLIERSAFDTFSLGGECIFSYNRIEKLHLNSFSSFLDEEIPTNLTVSHNKVKHFYGEYVNFPFETATHMEIFENVIPCVWGRQNLKPAVQLYLRSNSCQDKNTGNTYSLYKIMNSSFRVNDTETYQNNDTELNKIYINAIKADGSLQRKTENTVTLKQLSTKSTAGVTKDMRIRQGKKLTIMPSAKTEETGELEMSLLNTAATEQPASVLPNGPSSQTRAPFVKVNEKYSTRRISGEASDTKSHVKTSVKEQTSVTWTPTLKINTERSARSVSGDATNMKGHLKVILLFVQCCSLLLFYMF